MTIKVESSKRTDSGDEFFFFFEQLHITTKLNCTIDLNLDLGAIANNLKSGLDQ